jgi:hypothetical protein
VVQGTGRTKVRLEIQAMGRDLVLRITGGEAHVGAVAVCESPGRGGQPEPVLTVVPGHKEGPLAESCAARLAVVTGRTVCAVAGIHLDDATREEITAIVDNVERACARLVEALREVQG